jgi:hypothetical protein
MFRDIKGMGIEDTYEVDENGRIKKIDNKKYYDENGNEVDKLIAKKTEKTMMVDDGILDKKYSQNGKDSGGNWFSYDILKVRGDSKASGLFEFLANNTDVEWSQAQLGKADKNGLNYIVTSHNRATEKGLTQMIITQFQFGYTIRCLIHNHPRNTPYPSGLEDGTGDIGFATKITNWYNNKYPERITPKFKIYIPGNGSYINYNKNSTMNDFITIQLPEIIIKTK